MTIVGDRPAITGGVDTHGEVHVAAALDRIGGLLGVREFPATITGYASLLGWLGEFGDLGVVGVEGTGSYGAGLARHVAAAGIRVVEAGPLGPPGPPPAGQAPARWMRSAPPGPASPAGRPAPRRDEMARSRRSGR